MNRIAWSALSALALIAIVSLANLGAAATNWTDVWRELDDVALELDSVDIAQDQSRVDVGLFLINDSDRMLTLGDVETWVYVSERTVSGGTARFQGYHIQPGERIRIERENRIGLPHRIYVEERLDTGEYDWLIGGRIGVFVDDLTEPVWLTFQWRYDDS